ncbi:erythropoietin [Ornithorhynchus anatinus]|uniref:erythropoietin n=1 Tax=Ornithorhynchus anatinus TaxID=9258 RepID=UPI0010A77FB9|nr:erythropoietin [Ornithorhynchus anatinus]
MGFHGTVCPVVLSPLLLLLLLPHLGVPARGSPLRPDCDSRVLERYIREAKEAENVTAGCAEDCDLSENVTVPDTKVNFNTWKRMEVEEQAEEVRQGLSLLSEAVLRARTLLTNASRAPDLPQQHLDKAVSGLRSLTALLRSLRGKGSSVTPTPTASPPPLRTLAVVSLAKLFRINSYFLQGKLKLFMGEACRKGDR